ncbi:unnamed protein product [Sympodiomycopsis kandeliae]
MLPASISNDSNLSQTGSITMLDGNDLQYAKDQELKGRAIIEELEKIRKLTRRLIELGNTIIDKEERSTIMTLASNYTLVYDQLLDLAQDQTSKAMVRQDALQKINKHQEEAEKHDEASKKSSSSSSKRGRESDSPPPPSKQAKSAAE